MPEFPPSAIAAAARAFMVAINDQNRTPGEPDETEEEAIDWVSRNCHINPEEVETALAVAMIAYREAKAKE